MINTYLFDLDDTIIDSSIYSRMYKEVMSALIEVNISEQEIVRASKDLKSTKDSKVDTFDLCKALGREVLYYNILEKHISHTYTLKTPLIPSYFKKIKEQKKIIGIVTNSQEKTALLFLERFRLSSYVDFIESGKKEILLFWMHLLKRRMLAKQDTLLIDDDEDILAMAKNVGLKTLNVKQIEKIFEI